jgi:hypothetical protein
MDSYIILKNELKLIDVKFYYLSKKITEKKIIEHGNKFLEYKCTKKYNTKIFLSSFMITAFPHVVLNNVNYEIDKQLFVHSSNLINNFLNLNQEFELLLEKFTNYFDFWKKIDLKYISENVSESLFMINDIKSKMGEDKNKEDLEKLETKLKNQMKIISGDKNINDYKDIENLFWNQYEIDLKKEPPEHKLTIHLLKNIFELLREITPKKYQESYFKEYDEFLDIQYFQHLINNNVFDFNDFKQIFNYIVKKLKEFQSKEDDEEFKNWEENIYIKINNSENINYTDLLPDILKNILYRFNKIKNLKLIFSNLKNN